MDQREGQTGPSVAIVNQPLVRAALKERQCESETQTQSHRFEKGSLQSAVVSHKHHNCFPLDVSLQDTLFYH